VLYLPADTGILEDLLEGAAGSGRNRQSPSSESENRLADCHAKCIGQIDHSTSESSSLSGGNHIEECCGEKSGLYRTSIAGSGPRSGSTKLYGGAVGGTAIQNECNRQQAEFCHRDLGRTLSAR
jgi:hypothetical protein